MAAVPDREATAHMFYVLLPDRDRRNQVMAAMREDGVQVVVDPFSAPYLQGARVDYVDSIQQSGFAIDNPNAVASCGCGHSFQVAEGDAPDADAAGCGSGCGH